MSTTIQHMNRLLRKIRTGHVGSLTLGGHLVLTVDLGGRSLAGDRLVVQLALGPVG